MQRSAANRPWMPCLGNHQAELANVTTFTQIRTGAKPVADATDAGRLVGHDRPGRRVRRGLFRVDPGKPGGDTTITVTYYHAPTTTAGADYSVLETFRLTRPRHDCRRFGFGNDREVRAGGR